MRNWIQVGGYLVSLWLIAAPACGGTRFFGPGIGGGGNIIAAGSTGANRDTIGCFLSDTQNGMSLDDLVTSTVFDCHSPTDAQLGLSNQGCVGSFCPSSVFCSGSWNETGRIEMRNLAYDLTGQWDKIDYTAIRGTHSFVRSHWSGPMDHPRCDFIISLGDIIDVADATVGTNPSYATSSATDKLQWDNGFEFWRIIKASGIPFLPLRGNHDPAQFYRQLMETELNFTSLPFYFAQEPSRKYQYAIKFMTPTGKFFCVIGRNSMAAFDQSVNTTEDDWASARRGCGGGYLTMEIQHELVNPNAALAGLATGTTARADTQDPNHPELLMVAGGHYTSAAEHHLYPSDPFSIYPEGGGFDWFALMSDFQETFRNVGNPYGLTPHDGLATSYSVLTISPDTDKISLHWWSPYIQGSGNLEAAGLTGAATTNNSTFTFDFDARSFP